MYNSENSEVAKIIETARENQIVEVNGEKYSNNHFYKVKEEPILSTLNFTSLESLAEFVNDDINTHDVLSTPIIQIDEDHKVLLLNMPELETLKRTVVVRVENPLKPFNFNKYLDVETMIIQLQTKFVRTENVEKLLKLISSIGTTEKVDLRDNGISQTINIKKGVSAASLEDVDLPNIIKLCPIRIFTEASQIESNFLFRIKDFDGELKLALMDIDPTSWKLQASKSIKDKLVELGIKNPIYF